MSALHPQRNLSFDKQVDNPMTIPYHMKPQPLGGISLISPVSVIPAISSSINPTDTRTISRSTGAPAQLTIFYAGSVCVYDDVSPEKAQAIMLLAGNGSSTTQSKCDNYVGTISHIASTSSCLPIPSRIPVASLAGSQPVEGSSTCTPLATIRPIGVLASPPHQPEPVRVSNFAGSSSAGATLASGGGSSGAGATLTLGGRSCGVGATFPSGGGSSGAEATLTLGGRSCGVGVTLASRGGSSGVGATLTLGGGSFGVGATLDSGGGSFSRTPLATVRPIGVLASPHNQPEPAKLSNSVRSFGTRATLASTGGGLPLARKASLARFLEKRKERIMNTSPYDSKQKSPDCSIVGSDFLSFSINSGSRSYLPALH